MLLTLSSWLIAKPYKRVGPLHYPREQWAENWANNELAERVSKFEQFEQAKENEAPIDRIEPQQVIPNVKSNDSVLDLIIKNRKRNGNRYCPRCDYAWYISYGETNSCPKCYQFETL